MIMLRRSLSRFPSPLKRSGFPKTQRLQVLHTAFLFYKRYILPKSSLPLRAFDAPWPKSESLDVSGEMLRLDVLVGDAVLCASKCEGQLWPRGVQKDAETNDDGEERVLVDFAASFEESW